MHRHPRAAFRGIIEQDGAAMLLWAIREARAQSRSGKRKNNESRRERLVREIQENLDSLSLVELNKVYTYSQARKIVSGLWDRCRECSLALDEARKALKGYDTMLALPKQLEIVQRRMRENAGKPEYMGGIEYKRDSQYFITIESAIRKYGLDTPEGTQRFLQLRQKRERSVDALAGQLQQVTENLAEFLQGKRRLSAQLPQALSGQEP